MLSDDTQGLEFFRVYGNDWNDLYCGAPSRCQYPLLRIENNSDTSTSWSDAAQSRASAPLAPAWGGAGG